jgi:hypothetical protein
VSWNQTEAVRLCRLIEAISPQFGAHVALTGGTLYKDGDRKDLDILFYRIRQRPNIDMEGLWTALAEIGFKKISGFGWCYKATYLGGKVDCFFPESARDENGDEIEYGAFEAELEPGVVTLRDGTRSDEEILF